MVTYYLVLFCTLQYGSLLTDPAYDMTGMQAEHYPSCSFDCKRFLQSSAFGMNDVSKVAASAWKRAYLYRSGGYILTFWYVLQLPLALRSLVSRKTMEAETGEGSTGMRKLS